MENVTTKITKVLTLEKGASPEETFTNNSLVIEQQGTENGVVYVQVIALGVTEHEAFTALEVATGLTEKDLEYDYGVYNYLGSDPKLEERYGGGAMIFVSYDEAHGYDCAANILLFAQYMSSEEISEVQAYLSERWS